jgi:hypothetical protein
MATYRNQIVSTRSVDEVFAYISDFSNTQQWDPGVAKAVRHGSVPVKLGDTFDLDIKVGKKITPMTYEIVELSAPDRIVLHSETKQLVSHDTVTVRTTPAGTVLDYTAELDLKGPLKYLDPLLGMFFKRIGDKAVAGLRHQLN